MSIMQSKEVTAPPLSSKCIFCETAERIRVRHNQQITAIIETGRELLTLKEQFGDDQFNFWVKALEAEKNLPDKIAPPDIADEVANPFQ